MTPTQPDIQLHIDQLILDGLPIDRAQAPIVQAAVEAELSRLLTVHGFSAGWQSSGAVPSLNASSIQVSAGSTPTQMGLQIAQSVYSGLNNR